MFDINELIDSLEESIVTEYSPELDASEEMQLAARGVFSQSNEELSEMLDPYGDNASDFLPENY